MDGIEYISKRYIAKVLMCRDLDKDQVNYGGDLAWLHIV